ncbi:MAG: tyrosine-type recombinase/integrase [Acidobacteria bacterium]|nr:tyrosine-type recombinase/integrase [Acidobacteriota bacterium]
MLSKLFKCPVRLQELRNSLAGPSLEGFARHLCQVGYANFTAKGHIRVAEHFVYWTDREGIAPTALDESCIENFERHLCRCQCPRYGGKCVHNRLRGSVHLFLKYLRDAGIATGSVEHRTAEKPVLLAKFREWMRQQRGTSDGSLHTYSLSIRDLLEAVGDDPRTFDAQNLRKFVLERNRQRGWGATKSCITAVRMFLRFLIADGQCPPGLDACIPTVAHWRLSGLPQYLEPGDVERVIESCDRVTAVGRRDRAILLLLARMGLRANDVAHLRLDNIEWEQAWINVSGKGRRQTRLPLTQEIGDAIVAYVQDGRRPCLTNILFVRDKAPFRAFRSHSSISMIVTRAMRRAGVRCPNRGAAHIFRHSAATSMLRQGTSLQEISIILRHRSVRTTEIYAKVDVVSLRMIAQPWPEVEQC